MDHLLTRLYLAYLRWRMRSLLSCEPWCDDWWDEHDLIVERIRHHSRVE